MMARDANDVHRELGIDGLRKHGDSLPDLDFDTPAPKEEGNGLATATLVPAKFRRLINPADWEGLPVPPREWIVPGYIPHKTVTLLSGDGSVGKSLLALQLAAGRALTREWIGLMPEPGRTLILSAEDDADEMHRRLEDIRKFYGARMADLAGMQLVDLVGEDSILGALTRGQIEPTPMYHALDAYLTEWQPDLTILDVLADMFSGDENSRPQSRQFIGLLKRLGRNHECAFLLLAHPSLTGMNTGTGMSGSTGWNNAVRSRLYFQTAKASDGSERDKNLRTLESMKSNYGPSGGQITLEWSHGLFVPVQGPAGFDKLAAEAKADEVFLTILKRFNAQGRNAADRKGTSYAPALFAEEPDDHGITKRQFEAAMRRLFKDGKIKVIDNGRPSKPSRTLAPVE
ncbi:MAG TPA: AAA family ATPase [Methylocella sp.]|jgi:RecA-family ATPase|nr:AAA family ATPase [Methylocella sp.]